MSNVTLNTSAATVATEFNSFSKRVVRGLRIAWDELHGPGAYRALAAQPNGDDSQRLHDLWSACQQAAKCRSGQTAMDNQNVDLARTALGAYLILTDGLELDGGVNHGADRDFGEVIESHLGITPESETGRGIAVILAGFALAFAELYPARKLQDWRGSECDGYSDAGALNDICEGALLSGGRPVWEYRTDQLQAIAIAHAAFNGLLNADHRLNLDYAQAGEELVTA